ncbi:P-loop containing nucleoside triphosphate hydrolase protein [Ramaria rubella]|nr:P-loop containing nucleoside triphosphate hydrolase protein [Ramaria rubella]
MSHVTTDQNDEEFEAQHQQAVLDSIDRRDKKQGSTAHMGVIRSIEMHQFMCHPRLSFKFGPRINFITGHNGSGKSAVLSALTIALGGKATSTGRASGLKSFIREGQSTAEVTINIKNEGEEAFKPNVYGDTIIISRRFTKEGSSSYKIKSGDGKLVSSKRDELSAICDHMNIQVDNPMNILTQDSARQFLSASHPTDKYQFFLRGTQLTQLYEEYETCLENIGKTSRTLQLKKEEIPDLEKAFKEADARNNEATKARVKQSELTACRQELAWAHVKKKEDELAEKLEDAAKARRRLPRIEQSIVDAEIAHQATEEKVVALEAEKDNVPSIDTIKERLKGVKADISRNKDDIRDCKANEKEIDRQMKTLTNQIAGLEEEIRKRAESQGNVQAEREQAQHRLQVAQTECETAKQEHVAVLEQIETSRKLVDQLTTEGKKVVADISRSQIEITALMGNIEQAKSQSGNDLRPYGNNLADVLRRIQNERWFGEVPVGPFGLFVSTKDPKWAPVMRLQLGPMMSSFAVTDNKDRQKLRQMLDQQRNQSVQIIVTDVDLFDYSRGEPPEDYLTVLRALNIKDEFVKRILINQRSIEKVLLAETRHAGDQLLLRLGGGGLAWGCDAYIARRYPEGGATSYPMGKLGGQDMRHHMFTSTDRTADIQHWEHAKTEQENVLQDLMSKQVALKQQYTSAQTQFNAAKRQDEPLRRKIGAMEKNIVRLMNEAVVEAPVNIDFLEQSKATSVEEKESFKQQFQNICERRIALDAANEPLVRQREELDQQVANWEAGNQAIKNQIVTACAGRLKAKRDMEHWQQKLAKETETVQELDHLAEVVQTEFETWSEKAEQVGPRVENPRKVSVLQRQIESVEKALKQHERRQGASPEEIAVERDNAKLALDTHQRQVDEVGKLNKALKASLAMRMGKWMSFRQHIALRCKTQFQHHLWSRGYYGKVIFDHNAGTLELKVQTDDQASTQSKDKDPKALSGGEKSYSTICLLLALWESIQCPIRCLDEFDVFMDSVNRRISMKMMTATAKQSDKQYILITPQDMSHIEIDGETVRVHRMRDPERNQNPLPY